MEVCLSITYTISYLDNVLNLNDQNQLLLFSKDRLNEKITLREHQYIYISTQCFNFKASVEIMKILRQLLISATMST